MFIRLSLSIYYANNVVLQIYMCLCRWEVVAFFSQVMMRLYLCHFVTRSDTFRQIIYVSHGMETLPPLYQIDNQLKSRLLLLLNRWQWLHRPHVATTTTINWPLVDVDVNVVTLCCAVQRCYGDGVSNNIFSRNYDNIFFQQIFVAFVPSSRPHCTL